MTICTLDSDYSTNNLGHLTLLKGIWIGGLTAGGSRNNLNEFSKNPQYLLKICKTLLSKICFSNYFNKLYFFLS